MSKFTDRQNRENIQRLRTEFGRGIEFFKPGGSLADGFEVLLNADAMKWLVLDRQYGLNKTPNFAEIARDLRLNEEVCRMTINGTREPAKTFLDAVGFERVVLYRRKGPVDGA